MLILINDLLRYLLMRGMVDLRPTSGGSVESGQVGFEPPGDDWRKHVSSLERSALNVYLVDLRENRRLRSNDRVRSIENGIVYDTPAPLRLDCHYLISAWTTGAYNPGALQPAVEPTLDEHRLLQQATAIFWQYPTLNPSRIYPPNSMALNAWPPELRDYELPAFLAPTEGFPKLAEFWGTMGQNHPWKPVIYLIVTVPVESVREITGPIVTTRITEYRQCGRPETAEIWIQIGGTVFDSTGHPIPYAWVRLETPSTEPLQTTETDEQGRFTFHNLQLGQYLLHARAVGKDKTISIDVPSLNGGYDLSFT